MNSITRPHPIEGRHHTIFLKAGLYVLRYVSAPSEGACPRIAVNEHPKNCDVTLFASAGGVEAELAAPGDLMVVRASAPGLLSLVVATEDDDLDLKVELRVEDIGTGAVRTAKSQRKDLRKANPVPITRNDLSIVAHVSRRGDVKARPGEWIGGPELPLPIEGVELNWPGCPAGVALRYVTTSGGISQKQHTRAGHFAGTRGKAAYLTALDLSLSGPGAANYELCVDALFFGAAISAQRGREISCVGPSGREPLVGLRIDIVQTHAGKDPKEAAKGSRQPVSKVRVYRSAPVEVRPVATMTCA